MVSAMLKKNLKNLLLVALVPAFCQMATAAPQLPAEAVLKAKTVRAAQSPVPPSLQSGPFLLQIRDTRAERAGSGGCWSHCFEAYNDCVGNSTKNVCVTQVKTCMETCDRLSGMANPIQQRQQ
jgi:hypothetical protein